MPNNVSSVHIAKKERKMRYKKYKRNNLGTLLRLPDLLIRVVRRRTRGVVYGAVRK